MLRETLRDSLAPPPPSSSGCFDADMLAAWSDGTLSRRDRAVAESHAATCERCQAMLAAMAKIAEPLPARKWWQASTVRWLVPIAVVPALAVVVWMNVPAERQAATAPPRSDVNAPSAPAAVAETQPAKVAAPTAKDARTIERADTKRREQPTARADKQSAPAPAADAAPSATQPASSAPQPAPSSAVQPQDAAAQTFRTRDAAASAPAQASPGQPPSIQPTREQAPAELRSAAARGLAETVVISPPQAITGKSSAFLAIQSPNQNVRWRIVAGTIVERSTDGGTTWQAQSTGAPVRLTAGAAPAPTICWLVGPGGVVLVSRDGRTWERVAFPETIDLTAILAVDGSNATATAADGRVFSTTDGGKTWR
jgi:hypothetical protein